MNRNASFISWLEREFNDCDGVLWAKAQPDPNLETLWQSCSDAGWMLFVLIRLRVDYHIIGLAVAKIVRTVLHLVPASEDRPRLAIEALEAWCRGEIDVDALRVAASTGYAYAASTGYAYATSAGYAAYAVAEAAAAADAGAAAYEAAAYAAYAVAYGGGLAATASYTKSWDTAMRQYADIIREMVPLSLVLENWEKMDV